MATALISGVTGMGCLRMLEAVRQHKPDTKFYQASSSEMFGDQSGLLNEDSSFRPRSPYGVAKVFAHQMAVNYRESYGIPVSCGILFNHESSRRGEQFVTQKIARAAQQDRPVVLGDITVRRDWGYAPDYVEAMWLMLQSGPDDYVIATGESHSVKEFADLAQVEVVIDDSLKRPAEIRDLRGDASKVKEKLGWEPKVRFEELVRIMVNENKISS